MPDIFDQLAQQKGAQTAATTQTTPSSVQPAQSGGDIFSQLASGQYQDNNSSQPAHKGFLEGVYDTTVGGLTDLASKEYHSITDPILHPIDTYNRKKAEQEQTGQQIKSGNYADAAHTLLAGLEQDNPTVGVIHGLINAHVDQLKKAYDAAKAAKDAFQQGNYAEAQYQLSQLQGHGLAAAVPIVGPAAADAAQNMSNEKVQTALGQGKYGEALDQAKYGLGQATGLVGSMLAPEVAANGLKEIPGVNKIPYVGKIGGLNDVADTIQNSKGVQAAQDSGVGLSTKQAVKSVAADSPTIQRIMADPQVGQTAELKAAADKIGQDIGSKIPQGASSTEIGSHIQDAIQNEKLALGKQFDAIDSQISAAGGDSIKLPTDRAQALRQFVNDELDTSFAQSKRAGFEPNAVQEQARDQLLSASDPKKPITFEEARQLREQIRSTAQSSELTAQQKGALVKFDGMLGDEMQKALSADPRFTDLAQQRQVLGAKYQTFSNALDNGVLKNFFENQNGKIALKAGKDPELVGDYIVKNASPTTAQQLRSLTGKDFATVQDAVWKTIWKNTLESNDGLAASKTLKKMWDGMGADTQQALFGDKPQVLARQQNLMKVADALQIGEKNGRLSFLKGNTIAAGIGGAIGAGAEHLLNLGSLKTGGGIYLGYKALSKLVNTPGGADLLVRALKAPKGKLQTAAMANIVNFTAAHHIQELKDSDAQE